MTDVGDDVTVTTSVLVDGVLTDPNDVDLTVTDPDGNDTTPAVSNPSVGVYQATVPVTLAGRWTYTWTTDDPDSVEHGHFDVLPDPPRLRPLALPADLEARLGRTLTSTEATRAVAYLAEASALIRRYAGQNFDRVEDDVVVLRPVGTRIRLPQRPVTAVSTVVAVGWGGVADITLPQGVWGWDGIDVVEISPFSSSAWINLPEIDLYGDLPDTYRITYDHGDAITPDDVVGVCCGMVLRPLLSPSTVEGLNTERIGQYSYGFQQGGGGSPGVSVRLTEQDKDALSAYRRKAGSIQVRL